MQNNSISSSSSVPALSAAAVADMNAASSSRVTHAAGGTKTSVSTPVSTASAPAAIQTRPQSMKSIASTESTSSKRSPKRASKSQYVLDICIKSGTVVGGGLPNTAFVEVFIDGEKLAATEPVPSQPVWNMDVSKQLDLLEPSTPIIVSFSLYKKRWTSSGFKLVGSVHFPLSDHFEHLDKGPVEKELILHSSRRNLTLYGSLLVTLNLRQLRGAATKSQQSKARLRKQHQQQQQQQNGDSPMKSPGLLTQVLSFVEGATTGTHIFSTPTTATATNAATDTTDADEVDSLDGDDAVGGVMAAWRRARRFDNESVGFVIVIGVFAVWLYSIGVNLFALLSARAWLHGAENRVHDIADKLQQIAAALTVNPQLR